jgi:hypothetical protein
VEEKDLGKLQTKILGSRKQKFDYYILGKNRDKPDTDKRLTKHILKILLTHSTKSSNKQTSHHPNASQN